MSLELVYDCGNISLGGFIAPEMSNAHIRRVAVMLL